MSLEKCPSCIINSFLKKFFVSVLIAWLIVNVVFGGYALATSSVFNTHADDNFGIKTLKTEKDTQVAQNNGRRPQTVPTATIRHFKVAQSTLQEHKAITIYGDANLTATAQAEGWQGDGSSTNPFIIENYVITLNSTNTNGDWYSGILIFHTTLHVIIRSNFFSSNITVPNVQMNGIYLWNVSNVQIINNTFDDSLDNGISIVPSTNWELSSNVFIQENTFTSRNGISMIGTEKATIKNNTFHNSSILMQDLTKNVVVTENYFDKKPLSAIEIDNASMIEIRKNIFMQNHQSINIFTIKDTIISENLFSNSSSYAITIQQSGNNVTIDSNIFKYATPGGISINARLLQQGVISNNTFANNEQSAIYLFSSTDNIIANNTFDKIFNQDAVQLVNTTMTIIQDNYFTNGNRTAITLEQNSSQNLILNNTFYQMNIGVFVRYSADNKILNNTLENQSSYGVWLTGTAENTLVQWNDFIKNNGADVGLNASQAADKSPTTSNNTFIFNYWSDWTTPDNDSDGIVDVPYEKIESSTGPFGGKFDPYPLAKPHTYPYTPPATIILNPNPNPNQNPTPFGTIETLISALVVISLISILRKKRLLKRRRL